MTTLRIYLEGDQAGPKFEKNLKTKALLVRTAIRAAAQDAATDIEAQGSLDIAAAGNFGPRWTTGLHARVSEGGGSIRISVTHDVPYFMVHERGALIQGRPLLWIPLSFATGIPQIPGTSGHVRARDYPGSLFRVDRRDGKAPLLLDVSTKEPKYFGISQVRIPKRFHVLEIATDIARKFKDYYKDRFDNG